MYLVVSFAGHFVFAIRTTALYSFQADTDTNIHIPIS